MKVTCAICDKEKETKKEDITVTVRWILRDLIKRNKIQYEKNIPRVVKICKKCWASLKDKPSGNDYYWLFNKEI
jgi:hypothetical protein